MTEAEWLACESPLRMGDHLGSAATPRKFRLYHCGCCRRVWKHLDERGRHAVEVAERFCDGSAGQAELRAAHQQAEAAFRDAQRQVEWFVPLLLFRTTGSRFWAAQTAVCATEANLANRSVWGVSWTGEKTAEARASWWDREFTGHSRVAERRQQAHLLRDIFGNPFRPCRLDDHQKTPAVIALATAAYDSRDFSCLPILADALEEAGCDDADILSHCRGEGTHVRGCWVVDLVLGRQ
jgi:hypothetical protein